MKRTSKAPLSEGSARAAYLAMEGKRSVRALRESLAQEGMEVPSLRTMEKWASDHNWIALAKEHDSRVVAAASTEIAAAQTETAVRRSKAYRDLAELSAEMALAALDNLDPRKLKASDIRSLAEVSERAGKMAELLEGRATERNENVNRQKLDELLEEMDREVEERISAVAAKAKLH